MTQTAELLLDCRNATGESPVWVESEQALYWVDIPARKLCRLDVASGQHRQWEAPEMLACIAATPEKGHWIAGMESGVFALDIAHDLTPPQPAAALAASRTLNTALLTPVSHAQGGMRFNDGRCDRQGRFWAGTMVMDMGLASNAGALYRYDPDGSLHQVLDGLVTPNGLAFSPDGRTMYLSDSHPLVQKIWAFDYDTETGTPTGRRLFVDMAQHPGRPDGAAVDADGCYWICGNDAGLVHRFTPDGRLDRSLAVPVKKPAMCAFGGSGMDTLFVTSIRPGGVDLSDQPLAGGLFALRPGVRGLAEPVFVQSMFV